MTEPIHFRDDTALSTFSGLPVCPSVRLSVVRSVNFSDATTTDKNRRNILPVIRRRFRLYVAEKPRDAAHCSCRARGVEGSCAKHLTIEFHTVVMLLTFILIIRPNSIPSPLTLSFQA